MAIRKRTRVVKGVRYDMVFEGRILDTYDFCENKEAIGVLIERVDRNPGMSIVATIYEPGTTRNDEAIVSRSTVYPTATL